jgi:adenosine deaminase CECR1
MVYTSLFSPRRLPFKRSPSIQLFFAHSKFVKMTDSMDFAHVRHKSVEDFLTARDSLVQAEYNQSTFSGAEQTALEVKAGSIVDKIRDWEEKSLHSVHNDGSGWEQGHKFLHGLTKIEKSKLMAIASKAPKGCLLHCHFEFLLPPKPLLVDARKHENLYIKTDVALTSKGLFDHGHPQFCVLSPTDAPKPCDANNLFSKTYVVGSWMAYSSFLQSFPGGPDRGEDWVLRKMVLGPEHAYAPGQTVNG